MGENLPEYNEDGTAPDFPESFQDETPVSISYIITSVINLVSSYGWFIAIFGILVFYFWKNVKPYMTKWNEHYGYKKDKKSSKFFDHEMEMFQTREKMQEAYDKAKEKALKEQEEKKKLNTSSENKKEESTPKPETLVRDRKPKPKTEERKSLRPGFNPMMSDTSSSWRPSGSRGGG